MKAKLDTSIGWTAIKRRFKVEGNGGLRSSWQDDEGWTDIQSEEKWEEMMKRACEIPAPEDNGGFPRRLVIDMPGRKKQ